MSGDFNIMFCQLLLKNVTRDVKAFDPTIKVSEAETYIQSPNRSGKQRWFTFKFRDFYWEDYVDNAYDGKAQAWMAYLAKMQPERPEGKE